jgi:hypothetical protein
VEGQQLVDSGVEKGIRFQGPQKVTNLIPARQETEHGALAVGGAHVAQERHPKLGSAFLLNNVVDGERSAAAVDSNTQPLAVLVEVMLGDGMESPRHSDDRRYLDAGLEESCIYRVEKKI